jgi:hypothetical protein
MLLAELGRDAGGNSVIPFSQFPTVHFARFFVLDAVDGKPPRLVFYADVDGSPSAFLTDLSRRAAAGLDAIYAHCASYVGSERERYLTQRMVPAAATYVNTIGRTVQQIKQEAMLRDALEDFLDAGANRWPGMEPAAIRSALQDFVQRESSLAWARRPADGPDQAFRIREWLRFGLIALVALVLSPLALLGLPVFLVLLRRHEKSDPVRVLTPDDAHVEALASQEDHAVQNPFTSGGPLKPGWFRRFTSVVVLWGTNLLTRHVFNHANLLGVKTIHFGRWVFIDNKRRVLFATSYDGSLENYMDDFIDKIAWGLNIQFSNGVDYPQTNWLIKDGARNEQVFKRFNLSRQVVTPFWYAAYQGLTALNVDNNAEIRAGLYGSMDDAATRVWLRRF